MTESYSDETPEEIAGLFVGRKIVEANLTEGLLVLDDNTVLLLEGNEGCGGCPAGYYTLEHVATVENVITNASVECLPGDEWDDGKYRIFVFADNQIINVAEFVGTDGNGCYGTGFSITVVRQNNDSS